MAFVSKNPANDELLAEYPDMSSAEVDEIVASAHREFIEWRALPFSDRAACLRTVGSSLRSTSEEHATLISREMGKPVREARAEIEKCALVCDYYAENGERFLEPERVDTEFSRSFVVFEPLGVVLAIMPWNFPFWQVLRFAAPALMAGNAVLLKHAPNVMGCADAIQALLVDAGLPASLFRSLRVDVEETHRLIGHRRVRAVTLTGSVRAGRAVAERAGAMLKKTVLELGGSDPYIVLENADLGTAVEACVTGRLINSGQSCIAAKRLIVAEPLRDAFEREVTDRFRGVVVGDPLQETTDVGPLARRDLRDELHRQVRESVEAGASCLLGGEIPDGPGAYYPPTVLTDVRPGMPAFDEELFGPVAAIVPARDEDDALRLANGNAFGLGGAVFTTELDRGERIARHGIEAGAVFVNAFVRSDPRLPFGGVKDSGYGRELGPFGIREFVNVKTIVVD
jgi:succinate-semialdehyde dehydrogenase/glutarate-semialdehyde dehydrogenase